MVQKTYKKKNYKRTALKNKSRKVRGGGIFDLKIFGETQETDNKNNASIFSWFFSKKQEEVEHDNHDNPVNDSTNDDSTNDDSNNDKSPSTNVTGGKKSKKSKSNKNKSKK